MEPTDIETTRQLGNWAELPAKEKGITTTTHDGKRGNGTNTQYQPAANCKVEENSGRFEGSASG